MDTVEPFQLNKQQLVMLPFVLGLSFTIMDALYSHSPFELFSTIYLFLTYTLLASIGCLGLGIGYVLQLEDSKACTGMSTLGTFIAFIVYLSKDFSFFEAMQRGIFIGVLLALLTGLGLKLIKMYT